jgi:hypothetical protein
MSDQTVLNLRYDNIHSYHLLADQESTASRSGVQCISGSARGGRSRPFSNPRASLARKLDLGVHREEMPG